MKRIIAALAVILTIAYSAFAQTDQDIKYTVRKQGKGMLKKYVAQTSKVQSFKDDRTIVFQVTEYGNDKGPTGKISPEIALYFSDTDGSVRELNRLATMYANQWVTTDITFANGDTTSVESLLCRWKSDTLTCNPMLTWNAFRAYVSDPAEMKKAVSRYTTSDIASIKVGKVIIRPNLTVGSATVISGCFAALAESYKTMTFVDQPTQIDEKKPKIETARELITNPLGLVSSAYAPVTLKSMCDTLSAIQGLEYEAVNNQVIYVRKAKGYKKTAFGAPISSASMSFSTPTVSYVTNYIIECGNKEKCDYIMNDIKKFAKEKGAMIYKKKKGSFFYDSYTTAVDDYEIVVDAYSSYTISLTVVKK